MSDESMTASGNIIIHIPQPPHVPVMHRVEAIDDFYVHCRTKSNLDYLVSLRAIYHLFAREMKKDAEIQ